MTDTVQLHIFITGQVQGVWFRASTQEKARELELRGWVRNLADGRVELLAQGEQATVDELRAWVEDGGPPTARVDRVEDSHGPLRFPPPGFDIKR